jgi:hypothetical protein
MMWYRQAGVAVLAILGVAGVLAWVTVVDHYIATADLQTRIGDSIAFQFVNIPPVTRPDQRVTVGVRFAVDNPSGIGLEFTQITYQLFMDNLTDSRPFAEKAESIFVDRGGFFAQESPASFPARSTGGLWVNVTIDGSADPEDLSRLNVTFNGRYYPIVIAEFVYRAQGTMVTGRVIGLVFSTSGGIEPYAD